MLHFFTRDVECIVVSINLEKDFRHEVCLSIWCFHGRCRGHRPHSFSRALL